MHSIAITEYGGPEVLAYLEVPDPTPDTNEALVRIDATVVNHLDLDLRDGTSRFPLVLPHVLGLEGVGRIERLPDGYDGIWAVGDRVMIVEDVPCGRCEACTTGHQNRCKSTSWTGVNKQGCYAELIAAKIDGGMLKLPEVRSSAEWAGVQGAFGTAWHMLITRGHIVAGEHVLINAVGSGIGSAALQIAKLAGATVLASAGSAAKLERARQMGAAHTVDYSRESLSEAVLEATDGRGVDLVYDHVGGEVLLESLKATRTGGRVVTCGAHAGEVVALDVIELFRAERTIIGSFACTPADIRAVVQLVAAGHLDPVIDATLPLTSAAEAHERMARRAQFGKIVLEP